MDNFLSEMILQYKEGQPRVITTEGQLGHYLGSGEGTIEGPSLAGQVQWDLFEAEGETQCASNLRGLIQTEHGATITFDSLGFFRRPDTEALIWQASAAVSFMTEDERYAWLNEVTANWHGEFDMSIYQHHYRVYAQKQETAESFLKQEAR